MNILQIPPYAYPMVGGSESYGFSLSQQLKARGHNVEIWCAHWPRTTPKVGIIGGIPVYRFQTTTYMLSINPLSFFWGYLLKRVKEFDVLHCHSYLYFLINQVAAVRCVKRFPYVLHLHGGIGYIPTDNFGLLNTMLKVGYDHTVGPATVARADAVIACSESDKRLAVSLLHADPEKISVIPNAVDVGSYWYDEPSVPTVTYIGRLTPLKGANELPKLVREVSRRVPRVRFNLIGVGYLEAQLKESLKNYNVRFYGAVPHDEIPYILSMSSLLVLPSRMEGMPLVILEAFAAHKPVVAYDVGGVSELVRNSSTGFCPKAGDASGFRECVSWLLENDHDRWGMGQNGYVEVMDHHTWKSNVDAVMRVYKQVV